jgi:hypothetical protein
MDINTLCLYNCCPQLKKPLMRKLFWLISLLLIIVGIVILWVFFDNLSIEYRYSGDGKILLDKTAQVGDFIGGVVGTIFSLAGFVALLLTLYNQSDTSYKEQFEGKFFELIKIHRDNVKEINIRRKLRDKEEIIDFEFNGRKAFKTIVSDFVICRNDLRPYFRKHTIAEVYEDEYLKKTIETLGVEPNHIRILSYARINIAYCITFYGISSEGYQILILLFRKKYKEEFIEGLLAYIKMKPIESSNYWGKWKNLKKIKSIDSRLSTIDKIYSIRKNSKSLNTVFSQQEIELYYYDKKYIKFYGGHQHRVGHYFRHLFQSVNYVNSQTKLSESEKYFYVKTLRAQLSTYEQALLFVNSLSIMGVPWELEPEYKRNYFDFINNKRKKNTQLITKYNLIKNLPGNQIIGINYKDYYPNINYEIEEII